MYELPYTIVPNKLRELLGKIRSLGVPKKVTQDWLESIGYKSKNDRSMVAVLKYINFVDELGEPTSSWSAYRGTNGPQVLADSIREGYADLFSTFPDAYTQSDSAIEDFFSVRSKLTKETITRAVATFKMLCGMADFSAVGASRTIEMSTETSQAETSESHKTTPLRVVGTQENGLTININLQLTLPATNERDVYDAFFEAMSKHILHPSGK